MANNGVAGELSETTTTKKCIEWNIPEFSSLRRADNCFWESPSFYFVNTLLRLRVYLPNADNYSLSVSLARESRSPCNITSTFYIRRSDGTLITTMANHGIYEFGINFDSQNQNVESLSPDTFTIICDLEFDLNGKQPPTGDANNLKEETAVQISEHMILTGNRKFTFIVI